MMQLSDFQSFYDGPVAMQIRALLTISQCRVTDTYVTFKACGASCLRKKGGWNRWIQNKVRASIKKNSFLRHSRRPSKEKP